MGQAFDMLEIEGAWMVLQHLQELKGSKLDTAIQAVEQFHLLDQTLAQSWMSMTQGKLCFSYFYVLDISQYFYTFEKNEQI